MYEGNYIEISTQALYRNAKRVVDYVGVPVIGVVKMEGYGVTIPVAAQAWKDAGAGMFAVSEPLEALEFRRAGFQEDVLLMTPVADRETLTALLKENIILTVTGLENARFYIENRGAFPLRVQVKVDTGMGRFGIRWTDTGQLRQIYALEGITVEGIYSHFSKSFEKKYKNTKRQLERFLETLRALEDIPVGMRHIANSAAALRFPETYLDAVRVGSALVGRLLTPSPVALEPVAVCKAQVVDIKHLQPGDTTGYASVCKVKKETRAAVVNIGFHLDYGMTREPDCFPIRDLLYYFYHLLGRYIQPPCVDYGGKKLPLIGRIGSQHTLFDATDVDIQPGEEVTVRVSLQQYRGKRKFKNT